MRYRVDCPVCGFLGDYVHRTKADERVDSHWRATENDDGGPHWSVLKAVPQPHLEINVTG